MLIIFGIVISVIGLLVLFSAICLPASTCEHQWVQSRTEYLDVYYDDDVKCGGYWRTHLICRQCMRTSVMRTDEWEAINREV